jgi:hypothetical protein
LTWCAGCQAAARKWVRAWSATAVTCSGPSTAGSWRSILGRRRAVTTGTPSMTTLPQGTWAPWMAMTGTTTTPGVGQDLGGWPRGPAGGGEAASPDLPGAAGGALGSAVHGELDAASVAEVQINGPPAGERPPGPSGQRSLIGGAAVHGDPCPHQCRGLEGDRASGRRQRGRSGEMPCGDAVVDNEAFEGVHTRGVADLLDRSPQRP